MDNIEAPQHPAAESPAQTAQTAQTAQAEASTYTTIIHDGCGTWFGVDGLRLCWLTDREMEELEAGNESVLNQLPAATLLDVIDPEFISADHTPSD